MQRGGGTKIEEKEPAEKGEATALLGSSRNGRRTCSILQTWAVTAEWTVRACRWLGKGLPEQNARWVFKGRRTIDAWIGKHANRTKGYLLAAGGEDPALGRMP